VGDEDVDEAERLRTLARLEALHPGSSALAAGRLAGPATAGRRDVPIWEYVEYARREADVTLEELARIRFPIYFSESDDFTVAAADQFPGGLVSAVALWEGLRRGGLVDWDDERRGIRILRPMAEYGAAVTDWYRSRSTTRRA
jgi:hypothetical protein